jgi:hypothetical protein
LEYEGLSSEEEDQLAEPLFLPRVGFPSEDRLE